MSRFFSFYSRTKLAASEVLAQDRDGGREAEEGNLEKAAANGSGLLVGLGHRGHFYTYTEEDMRHAH